MHPKNLVAVPYRLARTPVAIAQFKLGQRLPAGFVPLQAFGRAVSTVDRLAGRLLHDDSLARIGSAGPTPAPTPPAPAPATPAAAPAKDTLVAPATRPRPRPSAGGSAAGDAPKPGGRPAPAQKAAKARAESTKAKLHDESRSNKSLASIRQGLRQTEAVAEARDHLADDAEDAEH